MCSRAARAGLLAFVALVALEHPLRTDLPPAEHFISEYASGSTHALAVLAFLAWGAGLAAIAALARSRGLRAVGALLLVAALGTVVAAAFATQTVAGVLPAGVERTAEGRLHDLGTLAILVGLLGAVLAALRRLRTRRYRLGVVGSAAALVVVPGVLVAAGLDWPGIGQRAIVLIGVAAGWLLLTELERAPGPAGPAAPTRARRTPAPARG